MKNWKSSYRPISFPWIVERLETPAHVLDVGGIVNVSDVQDMTVELLNRGCSVTEVDLRSTGFSHPLLNVITGDVLDQVFDSGVFDAVVAVHVLQHIGYKYGTFTKNFNRRGDSEFLACVHRWLKPNGILFLETTFSKTPMVLKYSSDYEWKIYSRSELNDVLVGFEVEDELEYDGARQSRNVIKDAMAIVMKLRKAAV